MNLKRIKEEALHLPENERAELVQKILLSIDTPTEEEIEQDWLLEATRRSQELDAGLLILSQDNQGLVFLIYRSLKGT